MVVWRLPFPMKPMDCWNCTRERTSPLKTIVKPAVRLSKEGFVIGQHLLHAFEKLGGVGTQDTVAQSLWVSTSHHLEPLFGIQGLPKPFSLGQRPTENRSKLVGLLRTSPLPFSNRVGFVTLDDMGKVQPVEREVLEGTYRGWKVYTMPPPSSGGLVILQVLSVLEGYDVQSLGQNSSELLHLYAETFQACLCRQGELHGRSRQDLDSHRSIVVKREMQEIRTQF